MTASRLFALFPLALAWCMAQTQPQPQPRVVDPGPPPSDAVVLFSGKDASAWESGDHKPIGCTIKAMP